MEYYVGIDIGTSTAKLTVIDENGSVVTCCEQEYHYSQPKPGWKEIWPEVWVKAVKKGMHMIFGEIQREYVKAIGVSGQMHTTVFLDEQGSCIRPAIMWNDVRTKGYFPEMNAKLTQADTQTIKKIISTGSPAVNLLWLKEHEDENFQKLGKFLIGPDFLVYYFTGKYSTDYCQASTSSLYDTKGQAWSVSLRELIGLPKEVYPTIKGSQEVVGSLSEELQHEFNLPPDIVVVAGTGDNAATAVATGSLQYGYPVLSIGTSGVLVLPRGRMKNASKGKEMLFSLDGRKVEYLTQGVVQSAGGSYEWYVKRILGINDFNSVLKRETTELKNKQLLFYPHLNGDKTIYADATLRGAFLGLAINDTREDLAIAVMEGVCFAVKQLIYEMDVSLDEMLTVTGGGANSKVWMQILADILNVKTLRLECNEGASYGAAVLARNAGCQNNLALGKETMLTSAQTCYMPAACNVEAYDKKYRKYLKVHDVMKQIYQ